jgi:hypothetical protein
MFKYLFRELSLFPFNCFGVLVSGFTHSHKTKEVEPPEVQELRKKVAKMCAIILNLQDTIQLQEGRIEEMEYKFGLEKKQIEDHWRGIVQDLERQLSQARMNLEHRQ